MGNEQNRNSSGHRDRTFGVRCVSRPATVEDVEEEGYLKANPDVARAGVSARAHFTNFGLHEGRIQFDNLHQVARLREEKLRRVKFRSRPTIQRQYGEAINFLTPKQIADFALPDAPPVSENSYSEFIVKVMEGNPDKLMLGYRGGAASCLLPRRRKYRNISLTVHRRGVRRRTPSI